MMAKKSSYPEAQSPLIMRASRLIEAFAKSDDERDFYLDRAEGFIVYVDLDKDNEAIENLEKELHDNIDRYCLIPKMSFYETKKIMESFVNEKVYDIDTKEKLLDIIQSKEARENFLEFIYDQHTELEKWQQFYQERSRIRIIEWLRNQNFAFVFEEDLDLNPKVIEKTKEELFEGKPSKEVATARKTLNSKAKSYYSKEATNPRPKRGRPPKQQQKQEIEKQVSNDIFHTVTPIIRPFLFTPDILGVSAATFSSKYESEEELLRERGLLDKNKEDADLGSLSEKLASLRKLSKKWVDNEGDETYSPEIKQAPATSPKKTEKKTTKTKSPATNTKDSASKGSMRSIIKKEESKKSKKKASSSANKKSVSKKRIIPKAPAKSTGKKTLRKIIPKNK